MSRVTVYLRTPLYSSGGASAHLPAGVHTIEGVMADRDASSVRVDAERLLDDRGRELLDEAVTLIVPWAKVDHMVVLA
jgi:hypothetical protein